MESIEQLENLKEKIETAKTAKATAEGRLEGLLKRLSDEFNIKDEEGAKKEIEKIDKRLTGLRDRIKDKTEEINNMYEWE